VEDDWPRVHNKRQLADTLKVSVKRLLRPFHCFLISRTHLEQFILAPVENSDEVFSWSHGINNTPIDVVLTGLNKISSGVHNKGVDQLADRSRLSFRDEVCWR